MLEAIHQATAMPGTSARTQLADTARALIVGSAGAAIAHALSVPAAVLIGPALAVSLAGLRGAGVDIAEPLRAICFVVLGIGIGTGFDPQAGHAILRWPLAFVVLFAALVVIIWLCRAALVRWFGFDPRSAALASAPGHLSFVLSLAHDSGCDVARVAVVQTIRLLALTLSVPFVAMLMGYAMPASMMPATGVALPLHVAALALAGVGLSLVLRRLSLPAPLLLGPFAVSALGQISGLTPGGLPNWLLLPAFLVLGALIGTRFAGMTFRRFRESLAAGLTATAIAVAVATLAALPVAVWLDMPAAHVVVAFAPGGLETMIALGAAMGASPGFVAATHIVRLLILTFLIPLSLGRRRD